MTKKEVLIDYWKNIDDSLDNLLETGYVKLPNLESFNLDYFSKIISEDTGSKTFKELGEGHKIFLKELEIDEFLTPQLYEIAKSKFGFKQDYFRSSIFRKFYENGKNAKNEKNEKL